MSLPKHLLGVACGLLFTLVSTHSWAALPVSIGTIDAIGNGGEIGRDVDFIDIDSDGDLDILVALENGTSALQVYANDGTGAYSLLYQSGSDMIFGDENAVAAGDCDGDGDPEVFVTASGATRGVSMFKNVSGALSYDSIIPHTDVTSANIQDVILGDLDADGDLDMVSIASGSPYETYENMGSCNFVRRYYSMGFVPNGVRAALGDLSNDGQMEMVIAGDGDSFMLSNFDPLLFFWTTNTAIPGSFMQEARSAVIGDWDGDQAMEFALGFYDQDNRVYSPQAFTGSALADFGPLGLNPIAQFGNGGAQQTTGMSMGDFDGDGDMDVAECNFNPGFPGRVMSVSGQGWVNPMPQPTMDCEWGDIDNDGDLDLLLGVDSILGSVQVIDTNTGTLSELPNLTIPGPGPMTALDLGEWSGTERLEIATDGGTQEVVWGLPPGSTIASAVGVTDTYEVIMADINGDDSLDYVSANNSGVVVRLGSPGGAFVSVLTVNSDTGYKRIAVGDLNGDGPLDIVVSKDSMTAENLVYINDGAGGFLAATSWNLAERSTDVIVGQLDESTPELEIMVNERPANLAVYAYPSFAQLDFRGVGAMPGRGSFALGDFDGNGTMDAAVLQLGGRFFQVFRGLGNGTFDWTTPLWESPISTHRAKSIQVADINNDGHPDFAYAGDNEPSGYYLNRLHTPKNDFILSWLSDFSGVSEAIALGDLEGDGDIDLVTTAEATFNPQVWYNTLNAPASMGNRLIDPANILPNTPPTLELKPKPKYRAGFGSSSHVMRGARNLSFSFGAYDDQFDRIPRIEVFYSTNGGGQWFNATTSPSLVNVETSPVGQQHNFVWDLAADNVPSTDNLVVQLRAFVANDGAGAAAGVATAAYPMQRAMVRATSRPMRFGDPCSNVVCAGLKQCHWGACYDPCTDNTDCTTAPDLICYLPDGRCDGADPCADITCPGFQLCHEGACYDPCADDADCSTPFRCVSTRCVDPTDDPYDPACDNVQCPFGDNCFGGSCFSSCISSAMCTGQCFVDTCDPNGNADPCDSMTCPTGQFCYSGSCYDPCAGSSDCTPPSVCYNATYCAPASDACEGVLCAAEESCLNGSCFTVCGNDGDCSPPNVCFNSACRDPDDLCAAIQCADGEACHEGSCYPTCLSSLACGAGQTCYTETPDCETPPGYSKTWLGTTNSQWANASNWSPSGQPTTADSVYVCATGATPRLFADVTVTDLAIQDQGSVDRNGYSLVVLGSYEANWCQSTADPCNGVLCPTGHSCFQGSCYLDCSDSTDCTLPDLCFNARCSPDACEDVNCPVGQICYGGSCFDPCANDGECTPPDLCYDGRCTDDPCDGVDCEVGKICVGGSCYTGCGFNTDCPDYRGQGATFTDVASGAGVYISASKDAGATFADFDSDGCLDLMVNTENNFSTIQFQSDCAFPNPVFTATSQCDRPHLYYRERERSAVSGDLNHDGYPDFIRNTDWLVQIYLNDGNGRFLYNPNGSNPNCPATAVTDWNPGGGHSIYWGTRGSGINAEGVVLVDYDGDKDLDVFIEDDDDGILVFRNNICSGGVCGAPSTFSLTEVTGTIGISTASGNGDYCAVADFDVDGDVDVLCRKPGTTVPDLYVNNGAGTFTASGSFNQSAGGNKGGVAFCDFDNDGDFDIFWTDNGTNQIWEQTAPNVWAATGEPENSAGLSLPNNIDGVACGDVDNDGTVDLFLTARNNDFLFRNSSDSLNWRFTLENLGISGDDDGEAVVMADYDQSGSLDIFINQRDTQLWKNPRLDNRYLIVRGLVDLGGGVTRDAIGATMTFRDADGNFLGLREINGGKGHGSQDPAYVHFGLRYGGLVPYSVTVQFPHGPKVERCVTPGTITGYQMIEITDSDADDITECTTAGSWASLIELPNTTGDFCYTDHCASNECEGIQCGSEFVCYGGNCKTSCVTSFDCPMGEICDAGRCVDSGDPECDGMMFNCPANWECVSGECFPICSTDSDCSPGEYCFENLCVSDSCGGVACGPGESCYRGQCFEDCMVDLDCSGGQRCYEGRCADNGCEALTDNYDASFLPRDLGKIVLVKQRSLPSTWARPIEGTTDVETFVGLSGGTSTNAAVPSPGKARVALYLDPTRSDGSDRRYVLWLQHGAGVGQGAAQATYRIRMDDPADDDPTVILDDDAEGYSIIDSGEWIIQAQATSGPNDTGGVVIGPIDAERDNYWTIRIDAAFSGDITAWEFYNADGQMVELDPREDLLLVAGDFAVGGELITPDSYMPCASGNPSNRGICNQGYGWCDSGRNFQCTANVAQWAYEICDGLDNDCDGTVDDNIVVPQPEFRQEAGDAWLTWLTVDENQDVGAFMNYTPYGTDDRSGGANITTVDGPIQAIDYNTVAMHRNLSDGALTMTTVNGRPTTGATADTYGDYDAKMRVQFPDSVDTMGNVTNVNSTDEGFLAWYDDRAPGDDVSGSTTSDELPRWETPSRFDLEWKVEKTGSGATAYRDADGAAIRAAWSGATVERSTVEGRLLWQPGSDDDDMYDDPDEFKWRLYAPTLSSTDLQKRKPLHWRVRNTAVNSSVCLAAAPALGCPLGRFQCTAGALSCTAANPAVCNQCSDFDGDGWPGYDPVFCASGRDCNDNDSAFNPDADEVCNGYDNDCDGVADIKDNDAYLAYWGEPRPATAAMCPAGGKCGPKECGYNLTCICPNGPGNDCRCGESLEEPNQTSGEPALSKDSAEQDETQATCASAAPTRPTNSAIFALLLFAMGWLGRRRKHA